MDSFCARKTCSSFCFICVVQIAENSSLTQGHRFALIECVSIAVADATEMGFTTIYVLDYHRNRFKPLSRRGPVAVSRRERKRLNEREQKKGLARHRVLHTYLQCFTTVWVSCTSTNSIMQLKHAPRIFFLPLVLSFSLDSSFGYCLFICNVFRPYRPHRQRSADVDCRPRRNRPNAFRIPQQNKQNIMMRCRPIKLDHKIETISYLLLRFFRSRLCRVARLHFKPESEHDTVTCLAPGVWASTK